MKSYLEFESNIKVLEEELEKLKDPFNKKEGKSEVDTDQISRLQNEIEELRKDIQTRAEEIIDVRNQPGFFGNQSRQAITAQLMNENNQQQHIDTQESKTKSNIHTISATPAGSI